MNDIEFLGSWVKSNYLTWVWALNSIVWYDRYYWDKRKGLLQIELKSLKIEYYILTYYTNRGTAIDYISILDRSVIIIYDFNRIYFKIIERAWQSIKNFTNEWSNIITYNNLQKSKRLKLIIFYRNSITFVWR
jgi:hypothetical protein